MPVSKKKGRQYKYDATLWHVRATIVFSGKAASITYSECVSLALIIQHAMHMSHIVISGLPGCTIFFSHYLINGTIIEYKVCDLIFSTPFV
jgi:hypothetical protein